MTAEEQIARWNAIIEEHKNRLTSGHDRTDSLARAIEELARAGISEGYARRWLAA